MELTGAWARNAETCERMQAHASGLNGGLGGMGTYYYLLNDTKKEYMHLCGHVKRGPLTMNESVHFSMVNYMMENQGDSMRLIPDSSDEHDLYKEVDLLSYPYADRTITETIVDKLNAIYGCEKYKVIDGIGAELDEA